MQDDYAGSRNYKTKLQDLMVNQITDRSYDVLLCAMGAARESVDLRRMKNDYEKLVFLFSLWCFI